MILEALADASNKVKLDSERVYLAGLSNGGLGVSYMGEAQADQFQGLIYLSPVMPPNIINRSTFQQAWHNRPILVITGETDKRIPLKFVENRIATLKQSGVKVTTITYPNEDHFLFFSQPEQVLDDISWWLSQH